MVKLKTLEYFEEPVIKNTVIYKGRSYVKVRGRVVRLAENVVEAYLCTFTNEDMENMGQPSIDEIKEHRRMHAQYLSAGKY